MDTQDLKEKLILIGVSAGIFLPFRLVASQYLAEHWLGNLGFATSVSLILLLLTKKNKLGRFGEILKKQIGKMVWGRSSAVIIFLLLGFMVYFGSVIVLVNQGNTTYHDDKEALFHDIFAKSASPHLRLNGPGTSSGELAGISQIRYAEYVFAISYAIICHTKRPDRRLACQHTSDFVYGAGRDGRPFLALQKNVQARQRGVIFLMYPSLSVLNRQIQNTTPRGFDFESTCSKTVR